MALYTIADLHLSLASSKPMDVFGPRWHDHTEKIVRAWKEAVSPEDTVVLPGDFSWALTFEDALPDLRLVRDLPGKKILLKGNHDFWWSTVTKMKRQMGESEISGFEFLFNNALECESFILCGTRGWFLDEKKQGTVNNTDFEKLVRRETIRLEKSLKDGSVLREKTGKELIAFFHFPPVYRTFVNDDFVRLLKDYGVRRCFYGHIHGDYDLPLTAHHAGIGFTIVSADYLSFAPLLISEDG